jgi:hypothetical protein
MRRSRGHVHVPTRARRPSVIRSPHSRGNFGPCRWGCASRRVRRVDDRRLPRDVAQPRALRRWPGGTRSRSLSVRQIGASTARGHDSLDRLELPGRVTDPTLVAAVAQFSASVRTAVAAGAGPTPTRTPTRSRRGATARNARGHETSRIWGNPSGCGTRKQIPKLNVEGSNPLARFRRLRVADALAPPPENDRLAA